MSTTDRRDYYADVPAVPYGQPAPQAGADPASVPTAIHQPVPPAAPAYAFTPASPYGMVAPPAPSHDGFAIASFVCAFFVPILGVIFGHIANHRAKLAGRARDGLAIAGLVLGYVFSAIMTLFIIIFVATAVSAANSVPATNSIGTGAQVTASQQV